MSSPRRQGPRIGNRGFGLLEAIVAMTILASSGLALFAWINQNMQTAARLQAREHEARLQLSALNLLAAVNPAAASTGQIQQAGMTLSWSAELVEPVRANAGFGFPSLGPWQVGLYRLDVKARDVASGAESQFTLRKIGTRRNAVQEGAL